MKIKFIALGLAITSCLISGCGHHYGFGIRSDSPSLKYKQTDKSNVYRGYEFETVLYRPDDNSFRIILQHPIYPLATPDVLISQVGVKSEGNQPIDFKFEEIEIGHFDSSGELIAPSETMTIPASGEMDFYVVKYDRVSFPNNKVREKIKVEFTTQGKTHTIIFDEEIFWVKRIGKFSAAMSI